MMYVFCFVAMNMAMVSNNVSVFSPMKMFVYYTHRQL